MVDINTITVSGRLTRDAVAKTLSTGTSLVELSLANNTGFGQYAKVNYFVVKLWGNTGKNLLQYLTKGKAIAVTGEFQQDKWTGNQDGTEHTNLVISTNSVILLGGGQQTNAIPVEAEVVDEYAGNRDNIPY